ncbi:chalcone isomerase family protein [Pseudomonas entomophila]|uniref:chalcone isomerase family protein n=1 Tax=Pseudomonas entomophila TaxID=312306 RepID=UPI0023D83F59|nr:chalcone isomerase family protein [Pseudomonas entomophila]MDF0733625.1 chalcone isomerase family protein [Pseudomonas entomophila]
MLAIHTPRRHTPVLLCLLLALTSSAWADGPRLLPDARLVGSGEFTWFGLRVYHARLWSPVAPPDWGQPFALELTYHRTLSRDTLVKASLDEMRRLGGEALAPSTLARWGGLLDGAFVDVRPGMRITGLYLPGRGCRFYVNGQLQRSIDDAAFSRAFFAIWLDRRARDPQLRQHLMGLGEADGGR